MAKKVKEKATEQKIFIPNLTSRHKADYTEKHVETLCCHYDNVVKEGYSISTIMLEKDMAVIEISKDGSKCGFVKVHNNGSAYMCQYNDKAKGVKATIQGHLEDGEWFRVDQEAVINHLDGIVNNA